MNTLEQTVANSIARSGIIPDKNKVRQQAREKGEASYASKEPDGIRFINWELQSVELV
jgi:hypothetical protein